MLAGPVWALFFGSMRLCFGGRRKTHPCDGWNRMADAAEAEAKARRSEESMVLTDRLKRSLATVVEDNNDLRVSP